MTIDTKILEEFKSEVIHEFRIYSESIRSNVKQIAEGHELLNEKMNHIQEGQSEIITRVDRLELTSLKLEQGQAKLEEEIRKTRTELGAKIDKIDWIVEDHETRIITLEKKANIG